MINFSIKTKDGHEVLGIALNNDDIDGLRNQDHIVTDLSAVNVGLWRKESDGRRTFIQPDQSRLVVINAGSMEEIGKIFGIELPSREEIQRRASK